MAGNDNDIQLKKNESDLILRIKDVNGVYTGEELRFNLEDIELPLRYQTILEEDKKNRADIKNKFLIIDKKQDHKGKKLFSSNEEEKIKALQEFYKREVEIYNMFLGERGVEKLLNGRELSWSTLEEIDEIIEQCILPKLQVNADSIKAKIVSKYGKKEDGVIE